MFEDLKGRVALVTGGATGIGGAVSTALGRAGMKVAVHFHAGAEQAEDVAREIRRAGGEALLLQHDITEPHAPDDLVRRQLAATGDSRQVVTDERAGYFGTPVDDQSLTPGANPLLGPTHFDDWLAANHGALAH